jgi:hypothetical protein
VFNGQDFSGRTPPKAPRWGGTFGGAYEIPVGDALHARVSLDGTYSSKYNFTDALRPDGVQAAYTRFDASVALINSNRGWTLSLIGRNLTNEWVVTSANDMTGTGAGVTGGAGNPATTTPDMNGVVEKPREIYLELSVSF